MPIDLVLPPKYVECQPYYPSIANSTVVNSTAGNETGILRKGTSMLTNKNQYVSLENGTRLIIKPIYNYSREYGRSVFTDVSEHHCRSDYSIVCISSSKSFVINSVRNFPTFSTSLV